MRSEDDRALREMRGWVGLSAQQFFEMIRHPLFDVRQTVRFSDLPTTPAAADGALLSLLTERLTAEGLAVYYADFTPPGADVHVVRVVVPGLEVETLTYGRLGARNTRRLRDMGSPIVGASGLDRAAVDAAMGRLYPLYREPGRHVIGFLEEAGE